MTAATRMEDTPPAIDGKLIPIMREAVGLVQMVFYVELKGMLSEKTDMGKQPDIKRLSGAVVNDLFGIHPTRKRDASFATEHRLLIESALRETATQLPDLLPHLTDALRMQAICDLQEGNNTLATLLRAQALNILIKERPLPLPSTFITTVRTLGTRYGIVHGITPAVTESDAES